MKAPVTDKTLGVYVGRANETKFADVRKKARDEYIERCKKRKKNKQEKHGIKTYSVHRPQSLSASISFTRSFCEFFSESF